jgi:predicted dehydrogenase
MYMKEIIQAGFIGQPYHAGVRYFTNGDIQAPFGWQHDRTQAGSGSLGNLGSHAIHLIQWWLGTIRRVSAMTATLVKERPLPDRSGYAPVLVDDTCAFLAELAGGAPVVFSTSHVAVVPRVSLEITVFGSEGSLIFQDDWGAPDAATGRILAMRRNDHVPATVPIPTRLTGEFVDMPDFATPLRACFARMASAFVAAIRENRPAEPNFQDGVRVQEVIDAVLRSANEQRWVTVE